MRYSEWLDSCQMSLILYQREVTREQGRIRALLWFTLKRNLCGNMRRARPFRLVVAASLFRLTGWFHIHLSCFIYLRSIEAAWRGPIFLLLLLIIFIRDMTPYLCHHRNHPIIPDFAKKRRLLLSSATQQHIRVRLLASRAIALSAHPTVARGFCISSASQTNNVI